MSLNIYIIEYELNGERREYFCIAENKREAKKYLKEFTDSKEYKIISTEKAQS